jgi:hypothetical protein
LQPGSDWLYLIEGIEGQWPTSVSSSAGGHMCLLAATYQNSSGKVLAGSPVAYTRVNTKRVHCLRSLILLQHTIWLFLQKILPLIDAVAGGDSMAAGESN